MSTMRLRPKFGVSLILACGLCAATLPRATVAQDEKEVLQLPTFEVAGEANVGYQSLRSTTGMRTNEEILNTPQSISVFNSDFFRDIDAFAVRDVLAYSSNVSLGDSRVDTGYTMRGQTLTQFFDGFNINRPAMLQDPYQFERIEILKGGNAVLYNNPLGGGLINHVYKKPQPVEKADVGLQVGSNNRYRVEMDATGPLKQGSGGALDINYRLTGAFMDMDTEFDNESYRRYFLMGSLDFVLSKDSSILVRALGFATRVQSPYQGTPMATTVPGSPTVLALDYPHPSNIAADVADSDSKIWQLATYFTHRFSDAWNMRWATIYYHEIQNNSDLLPRSNGMVGTRVATNGLWNRDWSRSWRKQNQATSEFNLVGDFATGPVKHKSILGVRITGTHVHEQMQLNSGAEVLPFNYFNPVYGLLTEAALVAGPGYVPISGSRNTIDRTGLGSVFLQDAVKLFGERLHLGAGGVLNYSETQRANFRPGMTGTSSTDHSAKPSYSALYKLTGEMTVYVSHNETDRGIPGGSQFGGAAFGRRSDEANELGLKFSLLKSSLNGSFAFFDNSSLGNVVPDPDHTGFSRQTGESNFKGYSFDFSQQIGTNWRIVGGFGVMEKRQVVSDTRPEFVGRVPINTPKMSGGLYVNYTFADAGGVLSGLQLGAGVEHQGDRFADSINSFIMDSYTTLRLTMAYRWKRYRFDLAVSNLTDEQYWSYSQNNLALGQVGAARDIRFKVGRSF